MAEKLDLRGQRFGRLTVIREAENIGVYTAWECRCDCGKTIICKTHALRSGQRKSCGCLQTEARKNNWSCKNTSKFTDEEIIGKRFGRLVVIEYAGIDNHRCKVFRCRCDCGNETITRKSRIISGTAKSCGCLSSDTWRAMQYKHGYAAHDEYNRLYAIYSHMVDRCHNENNPSYHNYGGRGIFVCEEWRNDVDVFMDWANKNGYSEELSIDRIDNNKGYSPENCRWVDRITQANNKRNNIFLEHNGEKLTVAQWSRKTGIPAATLRARYHSGWSDSRIVTEPINIRG